MTYYHDIVNLLEESDEPLEAKEIAEEIGAPRTKVYTLLKRMRKNDAVIADRSYTHNGVRMYQLRRQLI